MSKRKATLAINNINKSFIALREYAPELFNKTLLELGFYKLQRERLEAIGVSTLDDVE